MPKVAVSEPESFEHEDPFESTPVIVINEPANKFPFSGALIATPVALAPSANRNEPDPSVMSPVNAEAPSSSTPIFPRRRPLTEIVLEVGPSLIKEPVKPPTTCTAMAPPPAKLFVIEPWLSTVLLESKVTAAPAAVDGDSGAGVDGDVPGRVVVRVRGRDGRADDAGDRQIIRERRGGDAGEQETDKPAAFHGTPHRTLILLDFPELGHPSQRRCHGGEDAASLKE